MLRKKWPNCEITVFDRLPVPYGLLRYGVAPDHQHTKQLIHQLSRTFADERTDFAGDVEVGRDVSLDELREAFHVVVLATGMAGDRPLAVPGTHLAGVLGAGQVMRWVNDHPDEVSAPPPLGRRVLIVGNGNVAIDVARVLAKREEEFVGSDISDVTLEHLNGVGIERIDIVGRSSADRAKFDAAMVRELGDLKYVRFEVGRLPDSAADVEGERNLAALRDLSALERADATITVSFHFEWTPVAVLGSSQVDGMAFRSSDDSSRERTIPADSIITAIGFVDHPDAALYEWSVANGKFAGDRCRLDGGVYSSGWFRSGSRGAIPDARTSAKEVVATIAADIDPAALPHKRGFDALPPRVRQRVVDFAGWERIDAAELQGRDENRVRQKVRDRESLMALAREQVIPAGLTHIEGVAADQQSDGKDLGMKVKVLYATETGNAEMCADSIAGHFESEASVTVLDMADADVTALEDDAFYVFVSSTFGEGELPDTAEAFFTAVDAASPDLSHMHFAVFGLGDSYYDTTFNRGGHIVAERLEALGATRVADVGCYDTSSGEPPEDHALEWVQALRVPQAV